MMESEQGNLYIVGSFSKTVPDPDFKVGHQLQLLKI